MSVDFIVAFVDVPKDLESTLEKLGFLDQGGYYGLVIQGKLVGVSLEYKTGLSDGDKAYYSKKSGKNVAAVVVLTTYSGRSDIACEKQIEIANMLADKYHGFVVYS